MENNDSLRFNPESMAKILKCIAHPHRLLILCALDSAEKNVGELIQFVGINQTTMSNHLAKLRKMNLVDCRRVQQSLYYSIISPEISQLMNYMHKTFSSEAQS